MHRVDRLAHWGVVATFCVLVLHAVVAVATNGSRDIYRLALWQDLTGLPSPSTGMTRSFVAYSRGEYGRGFLFSPAAPLIVLAFCAVASGCALGLLRGKPYRMPRWLVYALLVSLVLNWGLKFLLPHSYW